MTPGGVCRSATASLIFTLAGVPELCGAQTDITSAKFPQSTIMGFPSPVAMPSTTGNAFTVDHKQEETAIRIILSGDVPFDFD
jgi:hypothetical protein